MIRDYKLPPTKSLPVLVQRYLRRDPEEGLRLTIKANVKSVNLEQLYANLQEELSLQGYDFIFIQFLNSQLYPRLDMKRRLGKTKIGNLIYEVLRKTEGRLIPWSWRGFIRAKILKRKHNKDYITELRECLDLIRTLNPKAVILLMTPLTPTSKAVSHFKENFERNYKLLRDLARDYGAMVVDVYSIFGLYEPDDVYYEDGYHLKAQGQEVLAEEIYSVLRSCLSPSFKESEAVEGS